MVKNGSSEPKIKRKPSAIANDLRMKRVQDLRTILIVEGTTDKRVFESLIDMSKCKCIVAYGKDNAIAIHCSLFKGEKLDGFLTVLDADFDRVLNKTTKIPHIFLTDTHDLETFIIYYGALEKFMGEYCLEEHIIKFCNSLPEKLLDSVLPIGFLRLISLEDNLSLGFNVCSNKNFYDEIIDKSTLEVDIDNLVSIVKDCTNDQNKIDENNIKSKIKHYIESNTYDCWQICSGIDVIKSLTIGLIHIFGNKQKFEKFDSWEVDSNLRLSFEYRHFQKSELYKSLLDWEKDNHPFEILYKFLA